MKEADANAMIDWLLGASPEAIDEAALMRGLCEKLSVGGLPIARVLAGSGILHPTINSRGFIWRRGGELALEEYGRDSASEAWETSPFYHLWAGNENSMRRRLAADYRAGEFDLLDRLKSEGMTDYVAFINRRSAPDLQGRMGDFVSSWTTDRPGGFNKEEIVQLERVVAAFALSHQHRATHGTLRTLLETYLGRGAAERVLRGNVTRGEADTIDTVIWYSDLVNFTRIADEVPRDQLLALLNDYAACLVESIEEQGGEVLKFIGDGILAIFDDSEQGDAHAKALDAAKQAEIRVAALNATRRAAGLRATDFYLALHVGSVLFGNFGSTTRLDFTVLGPAVNETSRIGAMCRSLDQRVIVSSAFAAGAGARRRDLVSLGRYALRGVGLPQELFTIDRGAGASPAVEPRR